MLIEKAKEFAIKAHEGQVRKYTFQPYVEHPILVAKAVSRFVDDPEAIAAALLHDTVEDCDVSFEDIEDNFGDIVAEYVWFLTKPPEFVGNRAVRKQLDRDRLATAPKIVKLIKICDVMHNSGSIRDHDPDFYEDFRVETRLLLDAIDAVEVMKHYAQKDYFENVFLRWIGQF
jgi:(p)ppGpp synthase/HD superfamily hydrolase